MVVPLSRRYLLIALGLLWLIDALLQMKPAMFTHAFIEQVILPNAQSQPVWIAGPIRWAAGLAGAHIAVWNGLFAAIQLAIGIALVVGFQVRIALFGSFIWSLIVWWAGEGLGGLLTGGAAVSNGAPGAILFYVLIGIALLPGKNAGSTLSRGEQGFARWSLAFLWIAGAGLQLQGGYLHGPAFSGSFSSGWAAGLIGSHEPFATVLFAIVELLIGIGTLVPRCGRAAAWIGIALSVLFWWVGQAFGEILTSLGTDPNSGPLWVLLTLCAFPSLLRPQGSLPRSNVQPR